MPSGFDGSRVERVVTWALRSFRDHFEWEDIYAEGRLRALQAISRTEVRSSISTVIVKAARHGALDYLKSRRCHPNAFMERERRGHRYETVELDEATEVPGDDFSPATINRVVGRELLGVARVVCSPVEWEALCLTVFIGQGERLAARALGVPRSTMGLRRKRALEKIRMVVGGG